MREKTYPNTAQGRDQLLRELPPETHVVLETGTYGKPLAHACRRARVRVVLAEVREVRRRAGPDKKTDRVDAYELAHQYRLGTIKEAYLPTPQEEDLRCVVRHRIDLAHKTSKVKCQVHAQLDRNGVTPGFASEALFSRHGLHHLATVQLPATERFVLDYHLRELELLTQETRTVDAHLASVVKDDPRVQRLMTIRGVDFYAAAVIVAEAGDAKRFPTKKHLASYAGLVPREDQSGEHHYRGRITKKGPGNLRWILIACATAAIKAEGRFKRLYRRVSRRSGKNRAKVAVAHKLITIVWALLTRDEDYQEKEEDLVYRKLGRMRLIAKREPERDPATVVQRLLMNEARKMSKTGGG